MLLQLFALFALLATFLLKSPTHTSSLATFLLKSPIHTSSLAIIANPPNCKGHTLKPSLFPELEQVVLLI